MDRRKRKTREAIFAAFINLLSQKEYAHITVGEIIECADVGRATFYAHFETKDYLLKALCEELFCHLFDGMRGENTHAHIFSCDAPDSVFLHLFRHLDKNDNYILKLLSSKNNEVFLRYFKENLIKLAESRYLSGEVKKRKELPENFWVHFVASTFTETVRWWIANGKKESAETITGYFLLAVQGE